LSQEPLWWDPFHNNDADPLPMLKRLRDEAPLYYNEKYDFYALSRYEDCENVLMDRETYVNRKGDTVEMIRSDFAMPSGWFIFDDQPRHPIFRNLFSKTFTPRKMAQLEPMIREYTRKALDPFVGERDFDFVEDLGAAMPMRVIGMLLGIPEEDQEAYRKRMDESMRNETGGPRDVTGANLAGEAFEDYIDWRAKNPSDDLMTELLNLEFEDETGAKRNLTRQEILSLCHLFASAGNETTNRLIGFTGKFLGDHPDQRRQVHEDRSLIPQTIEEVLRVGTPSSNIARLVNKDVEFYGRTVKAGSIISCIVHAANHDERVFENPEKFDIHRERKPHLTFGYAWHVCIGNPLARMEGRIALDEVLNRWRDWEVDDSRARLFNTSTIRGYEHLPVFLH
jgi:cytochrome P450